MNPDEKKRKAPAFQFYADDFLAGTSDMSAEEVGGYIRLLCHQWTKGGIPNDKERAGRMAGLIGSPSIGYVLAKFSPCDDGMLRNARLEQVRDQQTAFKAKQAVSGKAGAEKRWKKCPNYGDPNGEPIATPMAERWPEDSSPSPTPTPTPEIQTKIQLPLTPQGGDEVIEKPTRLLWEIKFGLELPESLRTEECREAVNLWLAYKSERRQAYKPIGLKAALTEWGREYTADQFPSIVQNSIAKNWQGIHPPRTNGHQQSQGDNRYQTATADNAEF